ncbi:alpha/beta fold hydrolase [Chitinophaga sancti]|uniref:thioesterase II family protein n=1 Tax=Chitinophaga sancti TaxID=1004 RepID=UPI002A75B4D4|nr:alpha/beta fold hydrolase [Chitinophaga sancti]WPQ62321.1 alpha/beta fold hydrolase [Chitinophaga sancti]
MKKTQLFLLHFAGGNCYSFDFLKPLLKNFEIVALELPGRGKRLSESLLIEFDDAANDIYNQVLQQLNSPAFMIYGHSMGAYLALKVGHMLEHKGCKPASLIVSGNIGPHAGSEKKKRYLMDRANFLKELELLGGVPPDILENEEYFEYFEPILRADFQVAEEHGLDERYIVSAPIYAIMGTEEEKVEQIANWGHYTKSWFQSEVLAGGHFFIHEHAERLAGIINYCHKKIARLQHF